MGLFSKKLATEDLSFRLGELANEVANLKTKHKHLELEWEELYDKVRHQMSRMSRRYATEKKESSADDEILTPDNGNSGLDPISAKILERRQRGLRPSE